MRHVASIFLSMLLAFAPQEASAAGCCSTNYRKAEELFRQGSYSAAIKCYRAAKACPDKPTYHLSVKGQSNTDSVTFPSSGGTERFEIKTTALSWTTSGAPLWCSVSQSSSVLTITCEPNHSTLPRSGSVTIYSGNQKKTIYISQEGNSNTRSAEIRSIWMDHNQWQGGHKGMLIHVKFDVKNMLNRDGRCSAYFYWDDSDGNPLKDTNNNYNDTNGNVSCGADFRPSYKDSSYGDLQLFMPYEELHITTRGEYKLKFCIRLYDKSSNDWLCSISEWQYLTYTRK